jgi:hypothetical protein
MTDFKSKKDKTLDEEGFYTVHPKDEDDDIQNYKKPWVNLTNQQVTEIWHGTPTEEEWIDRVWEFARGIEKQLKKENT